MTDRRPRPCIPLGLLAWCCCAAVGLLGPALLVAQPASPETTRDADVTIRDEDRMAWRLEARLNDSQLAAAQRMAAAAGLLRLDSQTAKRIVLTALSNHDAAVHRAMLGAIIEHPSPPLELADPLMSLASRIDGSLVAELGWALGRCDDHPVLREIARQASDASLPENHRRCMILALAHRHTLSSARQLMTLVQDESQPPAIRQTAMQAMSILTGLEQGQGDALWWRQWWQQHQQMNAHRFNIMLLENIAQRAALAARQQAQVMQRLVDSQRELVRITPPEQRLSLLLSMLQDPFEPVRRLAIDQIDQRVRSGESLDSQLRQGLLERVNDVSPQVRLATIRLLRNLRDEGGSRQQAARAVAARLGDLREDNEQVIAASLLLLTDTPVAEVVDRLIGLLHAPALRDEAAGALTSAIDRRMLDAHHMAELRRVFGRLVDDDQPPTPRMIELMGRIGDGDDWQRITQWLTHENERVRLASARAWANSDRALSVLSHHMGDGVLQPTIIEAAYRRGRSLVTFSQLARHRPQQPQLVQAWESALVAMAGRLAPAQVLKADDLLATLEQPLALRAACLTAAVAALETSAAAASQDASAVVLLPRTQPGLKVDLYLRDIEVLLASGSTERASDHLGKITPMMQQMDVPRQQAWMKSRLSLLQAQDDLDQALAQSQQLLASAAAQDDASPQGAQLSPVVTLFLSWADRSMAAKQYDRAQRIADHLRQGYRQVLTPAQQQQLALLGEQIAQVAAPAATQPAADAAATSPASAAAAPATQPSQDARPSVPTTEPARDDAPPMP